MLGPKFNPSIAKIHNKTSTQKLKTFFFSSLSNTLALAPTLFNEDLPMWTPKLLGVPRKTCLLRHQYCRVEDLSTLAPTFLGGGPVYAGTNTPKPPKADSLSWNGVVFAGVLQSQN